MIRLTDEEIRIIRYDTLDKFRSGDYNPLKFVGAIVDAIAQSQLNKVVEYLELYINIRTDAPYKSTIDVDAWQALKKEVGL